MAAGQEDGDQGKRILRQRAINLAKGNRWHEAIALNVRILSETPAEADDYNRLGKAYLELGEFAKAKESYKKTLELDPGNTIARKNLRRLEFGRVASMRRQVVSGNEPLKSMTPADGQQNRKPRFGLNNRVRLKGTGATGIVTEI